MVQGALRFGLDGEYTAWLSAKGDDTRTRLLTALPLPGEPGGD